MTREGDPSPLIPFIRRQWLSDVADQFCRLANTTGGVDRESIQLAIGDRPPLSALEQLVIEGLVAELYSEKGRACPRSAGAINQSITATTCEGDDAAVVLANRVRVYIDQHFREPLTTARLCRLFRCSQSRLAAAFRSTFSRTIHAYVTQRRIEAALTALRRSSTKIEVIAMETGYRSKKDFYRVVKSATGLTPQQVREADSSQRVQRPGWDGKASER